MMVAKVLSRPCHVFTVICSDLTKSGVVKSRETHCDFCSCHVSLTKVVCI